MTNYEEDSVNEDITSFVYYVGGNTRYYLNLIFFYLKIKKKKQSREAFTVRPKNEKDRIGNHDTGYCNGITTMFVLFIIFTILAKLYRVLFW